MDAVNHVTKPTSVNSWKNRVVQVVVYLYVLLFIYAASSKLLAYTKSLEQMEKSPIITNYAGILVWLVPSIEIVLAVLLFIPRSMKFALYGSISLMLAFTIYIYSILNYSEQIPCSCGGVLSSLGWKEHFVFNLSFILLGIIALFFTHKNTQEFGVKPK